MPLPFSLDYSFFDSLDVSMKTKQRLLLDCNQPNRIGKLSARSFVPSTVRMPPPGTAALAAVPCAPSHGLLAPHPLAEAGQGERTEVRDKISAQRKVSGSSGGRIAAMRPGVLVVPGARVARTCRNGCHGNRFPPPWPMRRPQQPVARPRAVVSARAGSPPARRTAL